MAAIDPYAPPHALLLDAGSGIAVDAAVAAREATFAHEAGLRAVGVACGVFGSVLSVFGGLSLVAFVERLGRTGAYSHLTQELMISTVVLGAGGLGLLGAWGYFRLEPWVRWVALPLALGALLTSFGLATPMVLYAAWLTWSPTGRTLLAPAHAALRARAPGWPRWWHWGHVAAIVVIVALYVAAFYGFVSSDNGFD
jgi:hypothetical protein